MRVRALVTRPWLWRPLWLARRSRRRLEREQWRAGPWVYMAVCPCGWKTRAPFADLFHVHVECCPKCGRPKPRWEYSGDEEDWWYVVRMRRLTRGVWWNPATWGFEKWETHPDHAGLFEPEVSDG